MPRPFRLEHPGAFWHVYNRGVDRRSIFLDDGDRVFFRDLLGSVSSVYKWRALAYTEMTNHYHAFIQTLEPTLSRGMQALDGEFAARFNKRQHRSGALFQSRFEAQLVDSEAYLLELSRYIVLNPVRARMVEHAGAWPWSSYRATAGLESPPEWLDRDAILDRFDPWDREQAMRLYREFVAAGVGMTRSPWEDLRAGVYLGSAAFMARIENLMSRRSRRPSDRQIQRNVRALDFETIASLVERFFKVPLVPKRWSNEAARLAFARLARKESAATYAAIAEWLSMTSPGARSLVARAARIEASDPQFKQQIEALELRITELKTRV
ncbi:MAG: transposase [Thermoanaerobaculia bacterium]